MPLMLNRRELLNAISECEASGESFQNCQKLATLYTLYDHLYAEPSPPQAEKTRIEVFEADRDNEFIQLINGKPINSVIDLITEVMETIKILNPRLYESALRKAKDMQ